MGNDRTKRCLHALISVHDAISRAGAVVLVLLDAYNIF